MRSKNKEYELNQVHTTSDVFLESYNKSIPAQFPKASEKILKEFQVAYPALFKLAGDEQWSIDIHRKRLMDWLSSYRSSV